MKIEEVKQVYEELMDEGYTAEDLLRGLIRMYKAKDISKNELKALCEVLGVKFKEDFIK